MNFAHPLALVWLGLAVPIVICYLLKVRLRRVPVSTAMFWSQVFDEKRPQALWQRLRHPASLLVQLAFLALVALSLADPYWAWESLAAERVVLVLDNSASMNATDVAPNRLAAARDEAASLIRRLRTRDEMAIISVGSSPKVVCGLTSQPGALQQALESIEPTDSPTRIPAAIQLARRLLGDHARPRIVVVSDGCFAEAGQLAKSDEIELISVGAKTGNVGITQFQVRRSLIDPIGYEIQLEVRNQSDQPVECRLEIDLADQPLDVLPLKLAPEERFSRTLEHATADGGLLVARLKHGDALAVDNQAVALLPRRPVQPLLLVTSGSHYLQRVFEAIPAVSVQVASTPPERIPAGTIAVYHRHAPKPLPAGNVMVIDPAESSDAWTLGGKLENPLVGKQQGDSPLLAHVRLEHAWMPAARKIEVAGRHEVLLSTVDGEPIYLAMQHSSEDGRHGKLLVLSVDLDAGDLPLRTAFPILMANAIAWFQRGDAQLHEAHSTGSLAEVKREDLSLRSTASTAEDRAAASSRLVLRSPYEREWSLPLLAERLTIGPLDRAGIWTIHARAAATSDVEMGEPATPVWQVASNLSDAAESDLRPVADSDTRHAGLAKLAGMPIWFDLTLLAAALISLEWFLYQRRWIS
jgi:hypothetical protein